MLLHNTTNSPNGDGNGGNRLMLQLMDLTTRKDKICKRISLHRTESKQLPRIVCTVCKTNKQTTINLVLFITKYQWRESPLKWERRWWCWQFSPGFLFGRWFPSAKRVWFGVTCAKHNFKWQYLVIIVFRSVFSSVRLKRSFEVKTENERTVCAYPYVHKTQTRRKKEFRANRIQ